MKNRALAIVALALCSFLLVIFLVGNALTAITLFGQRQQAAVAVVGAADGPTSVFVRFNAGLAILGSIQFAALVVIWIALFRWVRGERNRVPGA